MHYSTHTRRHVKSAVINPATVQRLLLILCKAIECRRGVNLKKTKGQVGVLISYLILIGILPKSATLPLNKVLGLAYRLAVCIADLPKDCDCKDALTLASLQQ